MTKKERKKGSGTPADAVDHVPHASGVRGAPRIRRLAPPFRLRARSPAGVPPRLSPKGVVVPKAQLGPGFLGRGRSARSCKPAPTGGRRPCAVLSGHYTRPSLSQSSEAPRMPVIMPAGMMPKPPGCAADEAAPAGTALAPAGRHHRPASLRASLIRTNITEIVTMSRGIVAKRVTIARTRGTALKTLGCSCNVLMPSVSIPFGKSTSCPTMSYFVDESEKRGWIASLDSDLTLGRPLRMFRRKSRKPK